MRARALQPASAWAEDRATVRTDPSTDPGAKTEVRAVSPCCAARTSGLAPKR